MGNVKIEIIARGMGCSVGSKSEFGARLRFRFSWHKRICLIKDCILDRVIYDTS